jgi:hypothetical protein
MKFVAGKHAFTFCTHGTSPKRFYPFLYPWLKAMDDTTLTQKLLDTRAEAEKGGRFRPLIPLGETDTSHTGYKQHTVHPQWILGKGPQKGTGSDPAT